MSVIAPASSATARGTERGGLKTRDAATASPASASIATTIVWPAPGQVDAMRYPGSGLRASDLTLARPSGNRIVFTTMALGWPMMNGPRHTAITPSAASADPEQRDGHQQRRPRGRLHRGADAEREAGQPGLADPQVGEPEAEERDHRHVGAADGE